MPGDRWTERSLGELIVLEYGAGLPQALRTGEGYPVHGSSGLLGRHSDYLIQGPGIIVGRKGTVGAVVWSDEAFWPIDTTYYVEPKGFTDLRWIYWCLSHLSLNKLDSSTGVPGLNRHDAYALKVSVPALPEQLRIAEILDTGDEAVRQTERLIAKLKAIKVGLLHDLLTRGLDEHGQLRDPEAHPGGYEESAHPLQSDWQEETLASTAQPGGFIDGDWIESPYITDKGIRLVQTGNIGMGEFVDKPDNRKFISEKSFRQLNCKWVYPGDILICRLADPIGRTCRVPDEIGPCVTAVDCTIYRPEPDVVNASFAVQILNWGPQLRRLTGLAGGSTRQRISRTNLGDVILRLPSLSEQRRIAAILDAHDTRIRAEEAELAKLRQLKRGLMDDLLTGRVRVTNG